MKWTLLPLLASALIVYALIFLAQSGPKEPSVATQPSLSTTADTTPVAVASVPRAPVPTPASSSSTVTQAQDTSASELARTDGAPQADDPEAWAKGCGLYEQEDFAAARVALEQAVRDEESRAGRHYLLGLCYLKLDESDLALSELKRAVELKPDSARYQVNLARAYLGADDSETAREVVDSALETQLDFADAWEVLGRIELAQGNRDEAAAAFTKAVQLDPEHAWAWNNLAYLRILQARFDEAVEPLQNAIRLRPKVASFQNNMGVVEERLGRFPEAVACYEKASDLGHPYAGDSAERVREVVAATAHEAEEGETQLVTTSADSLGSGW